MLDLAGTRSFPCWLATKEVCLATDHLTDNLKLKFWEVNKASRKYYQTSMHIKGRSLVFVIVSLVIYYIGLFVINLPLLLVQNSAQLSGFISVTAAVSLGFVAMLSSQLVSTLWVEEFVAACSQLGRQQLASPAETDVMLERYEKLRASAGTLLLIMFSSIQLIIIFSVFNILPGTQNVPILFFLLHKVFTIFSLID